MKHDHLRPMTALDRTLMTLSCSDSDPIPKVANAGRIVEHAEQLVQIMHDGTMVVAGGYHGDWMAQIIRGLRGHHEPQEELIFHSLMPYCRHNTQFVELGSFWAYYTLWYLREIPGSQSVCVEPAPNSLTIGHRNVALNGFSARVSFHEGWVGDGSTPELTLQPETTDAPRTLPCIDMDAVFAMTHGRPVEILHMDTQGAELPFLTSIKSEHRDRIRFLVISTHHHSISGCLSTHEDCLAVLNALGARVLVEHDVVESYSGDGLIVASFAVEDEAITLPKISRNGPATSLFRGQ